MTRSGAEVLHQLLRREQRCSRVLKKPVAAAAGPAPRIAGDDPDGALLLCGKASGDQSTAAIRTLHHHKSAGQAHQQAIPGGEMTRLNGFPWPALAQQQTVLSDVFLQRLVMPRIDTIQWCAQHSNRNTTSRQATAMGCRINALCETADHGPAGFSQNSAEMFSHAKTMIRSSTGSDHSHSSTLTDPIQDLRSPLLMEHQRGAIQPVQGLWPELIQGGQNIAGNLELRTSALLLPVTLNLFKERLRPGQHLSQALAGPGPALIQAHIMLSSSGLKRRHP